MGPRRDNSKAVGIRQQRAAQAEAKKVAELKVKEDAKWFDPGTKQQRAKDARKAAAEQKIDGARKRAEEKKQLEAAEMDAIKSNKQGKPAASKKLTQYEIMQRRLLAAKSPVSDNSGVTPVDLLTPNINHQLRDMTFDAKLRGDEIIDASGIDKTLAQLDRATFDAHPEKRARAAYRAYEERELQNLRAEFPTLKRSQLLERIHRAWLKSPENPMNQQC